MFGKDVDQTTDGNICSVVSGNTCQSGTAGSGSGEFQTPTFIAVDPSSGDLYVADTANGTISKFAETGDPVESWATKGQIGGFGTLAGIAVDPSGDLFVLEESSTVHEYISTGAETTTFGAPRGTAAFGLAVDAEDNLYKVDGSPNVTKLSDTGEELSNSLDNREDAVGLAIDPSTNDLYVVQSGEGGFVNEFQLNCGENCAPLESFGASDLNGPGGLSIGGASNDAYIANTGSADIAVFTEVIVPDVTTESASNVEPGKSGQRPSATITGHIDPAGGGEVTACYFEYGQQNFPLHEEEFPPPHYKYEHTVPCSPAPPYSSANGVSAALSGLEAGTTYHYRLVAANANGTNRGSDQTFRTIGLPIFAYSATPSTAQAGGHPNIFTSVEFAERFFEEFSEKCLCQDPETFKNILPAGLTGDPRATPQCTRANFALERCSPSTQVGEAEVKFTSASFLRPVYNVAPEPDQAGVVGYIQPLANTPIYIVLSARTGSDYGLDAVAAGVPQTIPFYKQTLELWGVPAEHNGGGANPMPFLDNPTSCGEPLSTSIELLSYDGGFNEASSPWPAITGCDQLSFNPSLYADPTTKQADSASGLDVDLSVPQNESPTQPSPSEIRALTVKLPKGMSINPNAADGKSACSDAEARFGTEEEAQCPEFSKVGTATLDSSALAGPIPGAIYIGDPQPGNRYRLILTANGFNTHVKLAGSVQPDPQTGQLVTSFPNLPQAPFSAFDLHFFGSERGLLATPTQCGTYSVESTFTPWDASLSTQTSVQYFKIEEGPGGGSCPPSPRPFNPSFTASVSESTAGAHTPFSLELTRNDGDQDLSALNVTTPPGFSATLKGVRYCSGAALAAAANTSYSGLEEEANPSCPAASQIGTAQAGSGAGNHPVYLPGKVYLAGPYKGAPLSLAVITPAVSGPYDLGNVVVRAALKVNPETAQINAVSDPLPQILQGIPLRLRSIRINLNRPNFVLNPTNCDPFSVATEVFGEEGGLAKPSAHFQVANCRDLPFAPKLTMGLTGSTKRAGNPALKAMISYPQGGAYANIASTSVTLPATEIIDNAHINNPCTKVVFAEGSNPGEKRPAGSVIGFVKAQTPLLEAPLEGPVYLRSASAGHKLPDIVAALNGQIDISLDGHVDTVYQKLHGEKVARIRTTFETVPDAPVSNFTLNLDGGGKGLLQNDTNLCKHALHATADIAGQNGKTANQNPVLGTSCAKKKRKGHRTHGVHKNRRVRG